MKTLILIRHAKSSWGIPGQPDHERGLNKRGKRDAPMMGRRLAEGETQLQQIVSSSAVRARLTAEAVATELDHPLSQIAIEPQIYEAGVRELLNVIHGLDDELNCVALVGHNPGMTNLSNLLSGSDIDNVPTCGVVNLGYAGQSWGDIRSHSCQLVEFDYPKKHKAGD